uniref:Uncharacterized protein n=1 Tax=Globisporangium ultimum (strain ATCC 200006 / CBS 805.95 / DAOM BR144) TaxID=431595 RepID=K3W8Y9_GLOUD
NASGRSLDIATVITVSENPTADEIVGKPKRKHNNTTRRRQKQELEYLRAKVEELEHKLKILRGRADGSAFYKSPTPTASTTSSEENGIVHSVEGHVPLESETLASSQSLWERVARNQMEGKQRAEIENARLREMVVNQLKIVKGLEKILSKRINEPEDSFSEERKRLRVSNESEASIFERLAKDLDQRYNETAKVFCENGLAASKTELQHAEMKVDALSGMYMEFLDSKILPFGMQTTQDALWRSLARENLRLTDGHYAVVEKIDDFLTAKLAINLRHKRLQAQVDVKLVAKQFLQEDRAVIVWACQSDAEGPMCGWGGIQLIDSGWTVIEPLARADGMPASIIRSCARVVPEFAESETEEDQPVGLLTDLVTGSFLRNMSAFHQSAEDLLVEEALRDGSRW